MKKQIKVVCAIIENEASEIFVTLRASNMSLPRLWEFPGGKVEPNENHTEALKREIHEELHCEIHVDEEPFRITTHAYEAFVIEMHAYKANLISELPTLSEHAASVWLKREYLDSLVWAPADLPIVKQLKEEASTN